MGDKHPPFFYVICMNPIVKMFYIYIIILMRDDSSKLVDLFDS
jgi:hypothetical protein